MRVRRSAHRRSIHRSIFTKIWDYVEVDWIGSCDVSVTMVRVGVYAVRFPNNGLTKQASHGLNNHEEVTAQALSVGRAFFASIFTVHQEFNSIMGLFRDKQFASFIVQRKLLAMSQQQKTIGHDQFQGRVLQIFGSGT